MSGRKPISFGLTALAAWLAVVAPAGAQVEDAFGPPMRTRGTRIVGGDVSRPGSWPWQVALFQVRPANAALTFNCGGTLIEPRWVLTAAHCVVDKDTRGPVSAQSIAVQVGTQDLTTGGERVPVARVIVHERFNLQNLQSDIALLQLQRPAQVATITLVSPENLGALRRPGTPATTIGWGLTEFSREASPQLRHVIVPMVENERCRARYTAATQREITEEHICAGFAEGGHDSCQGDSGGPLMVADATGLAQIGIVSWGGRECGAPGNYGVYTNLPHFMDWVRRQVAAPVVTTPAVAQQTQGVFGATNVQLGAVAPTQGPNASLTISVVPGTTVRVGDYVQLRIQTNRPGKLLVINQDADGTLVQIFPNRFSDLRGRSAQIAAGRALLLPDADHGFRLRVEGKPGPARLIVFVTDDTVRLDDVTALNPDLRPIRDGRAYAEAIARRLPDEGAQGPSGGIARWIRAEARYVVNP